MTGIGMQGRRGLCAREYRFPETETVVSRRGELDEQLVGAARGQSGSPRHDERRALTVHQDCARRRIGAGGEGEACFLRRVRHVTVS